MQLQSVGLRGRRFTIQFYELMREFGSDIPWLEGLDELGFATNGEWFREELLRRLGQATGDVTPYQFIDNNPGRTYIGGLLHFTQSPEHLRDRHNNAIAERLAGEGASYISCLQVRTPQRGTGVGTEMMRRAIGAILDRHGSVWGVVSDPRLVSWYVSLGAVALSRASNRDDLWIVHWPLPPA